MPILLLSGGLDSAVLLARKVMDGCRPLCLAFDYGQRHRRELESAERIAYFYRQRFECNVIPPSLFGGSALTGTGDVPHAHYADPSQSATVVPNRNAVLLSLAAARAVERRDDTVSFAAHAGDAAIYPDCRPEFVEAIDRALRLGCGVGIQAPFLGMTKRDIVTLGRRLAVPFELTWSCYEGAAEPCGKCGACVERQEAMT